MTKGSADYVRRYSPVGGVLRGGVEMYLIRKRVMTSVRVVPSALAFSRAGFQIESGTRRLRTGVFPVAGLPMS
ncbi:hypothetical protein ACQP2T_63915 (plasmid) [Nonomuraea sp. CA-143628]|uniref:hypothetical protein n=1 Tax=Nonomuraea sp. CA-143628 TaxID=3239997 RepID=UPI003D8F5AE3